MTSIKSLLYQDYTSKSLYPLDKAKRRWARTIKRMPRSSEVFSAYQELLADGKIKKDPELEKNLKVRKVRTMSGVAPFAVMMKPFFCPGECTYCVLEPGMPKSYMSDEPAASRAKMLAFDPEMQITTRVDQMEKTGHKPEKLQIIVIGGTFSAYPKHYKQDFLKAIYDSCNKISLENPTDYQIPTSIQQSQQINESAKYRIIGMSIETRPDWITDEEIKLLREYGVTKVQMGVQALDDQILDNINRGHHLDAVRDSTKRLRNAGFKINYHFMPNLPGSNPEKDVQMCSTMFSDSNYRPDTLKIYPCIVIPTTPLHEQWKRGEYLSYDDDTLARVLVECKQQVQPYCRIDRLVRDITRNWTAAGTLKTNMREIVQRKMKELQVECRCIRCREVRDQSALHDGVTLQLLDYEANGGLEKFIHFSDDKHLYGMIRLRLVDNPAPLYPALRKAALIRELQVFGQQVGIIKTSTKDSSQHQSLGHQLVKKAEEEAKKAGFHRVAIISGVGVRGYYEKLGYRLEDTYMIKGI